MCSAILYALLAGVCLSAHLLRCVESLPVPTTTTESPPISPAVSSDADTDDSRAESSPGTSNHAVVHSSQHDSPASLASHVYAIMAIFNQPTSPPETEEQIDPNLPLSSAVVSSSTASLSEENCSSEAVAPCRKRSYDRLTDAVFSYMTGPVKRSLRGANPSASNWPVPNLDQVPNDDTSSDSAESQPRDTGSPSPEASNEASSSSSDSSSTNSQPSTPM